MPKLTPEGKRRRFAARADKERVAKELRAFDLLGQFRAALAKTAASPHRSGRKGGPKRLLHEEDYLSAFLFAQFNPVIDSMRGLCECSQLERVQQQVCSRPISLGSFSEAQQVFGHQRLAEVFELLIKDNLRFDLPGRRGKDKAPALLNLADSSVFRALPRMAWAEWGHQNTTQRAVRLHLLFDVFDGEPSKALVTEGRRCERKALAEMIEEGGFYVGDRYYGRDYQFFKQFDETRCGFLFRLCENANVTVLEDLPLDEEDRQAGVVCDQRVRLGARQCWHSGPVRVVRIEKPDLDEPLILVTNQLDREAFSAALLAEIYRQRWAIELFFRWIKCIFGRPEKWHWFAESPEGAQIEIYIALIAAVLLARQLGRLPSKRAMEMLQFHAMGWASTAELEVFLQRELRKKSG